MRLLTLIQSLDAPARAALVQRHRVELSSAKRLPEAEQIARAICKSERIADFDSWPSNLRAAASILAAQRSGLPRLELPGGVLRLLQWDLVFPLGDRAERVVMPTVFRAQLPVMPGEGRARARALVATASEEVLSQVWHGLPDRPRGPWPLRVEGVLEHLERREAINAAIATLNVDEQRLLAAIESRGGELSVDSLLRLGADAQRHASREPLPRTSRAFALVRAGLLWPIGERTYVLPEEVASLVGSRRRKAANRAQAKGRERLRTEAVEVGRARLGEDVGLRVAGLLAGLASHGAWPPGARGVARSSLTRAASRTGLETKQAEMLVALVRGGALIERGVAIEELGAQLFHAWCSGSGWDDGRFVGDGFRIALHHGRLPSPTALLRDIVLEELVALPLEGFVAVTALVDVVLKDPRVGTMEHLLAEARRLAPDVFRADLAEIAFAIVECGLAGLGAIDTCRGADGDMLMRLSPRARKWHRAEDDSAPLRRSDGDRDADGATAASSTAPGRRTEDGIGRKGAVPLGDGEPSASQPWARRTGPNRFDVARGARLGPLVRAARVLEAHTDGLALVLVASVEGFRRALRHGHSVESIRERLAELEGGAGLAAVEHDGDGELADILAAAVGAYDPLPFSAAGGFLWVDDPALLGRLAQLPGLSTLLAPRSPPGGLLLAAGVTMDELEGALASLGVELAVADPPAAARPAARPAAARPAPRKQGRRRS